MNQKQRDRQQLIQVAREIQETLTMKGSTQRPRRREWQIAGLIKDSGTIRLIPSGRSSVVWVAADTEEGSDG